MLYRVKVSAQQVASYVPVAKLPAAKCLLLRCLLPSCLLPSACAVRAKTGAARCSADGSFQKMSRRLVHSWRMGCCQLSQDARFQRAGVPCLTSDEESCQIQTDEIYENFLFFCLQLIFFLLPSIFLPSSIDMFGLFGGLKFRFYKNKFPN